MLSNEMLKALAFEEWVGRAYRNSIDYLGYHATHDLECDFWVGEYMTRPSICDCRLSKNKEKNDEVA